jgi:UDP-GlcNAc:undecaprenyl-phosphate GlcNAc-1-phosphate transferase
MFQPDKGHIHHHLIRFGFSTRKSVFIIYGFSIVLCLYTVLVVNYRSNVSGLLLIIILAVAFVMVRKLGYLEYVALDKFSGWLRDVTDVAGLSRGRRSFLSQQIDMDQARTMEDLWDRVVGALEMLSFDRAEMCLNGVYKGRRWAWAKGTRNVDGDLNKTAAGSEHGNKKGSRVSKDDCCSALRDGPGNGDHLLRSELSSSNDSAKIDGGDHLFRIEVPLSSGGQIAGKLFLTKDVSKNPLSPHTLHRIEHLRRTIDRNLSRLQK